MNSVGFHATSLASELTDTNGKSGTEYGRPQIGWDHMAQNKILQESSQKANNREWVHMAISAGKGVAIIRLCGEKISFF